MLKLGDAVRYYPLPDLSGNRRTALLGIICMAPSFVKFLAIISCALVAAGPASAGQSPYATTVIINGKVITADSDEIEDITFAEAVAIQDDEIMGVGSDEEIREYIADWTEIIDAGGNTVLPGLIDTHNHLYENTLTAFPWVLKKIPELLQIELESDRPADMLDLLKKAVTARASQIPDGQWIQVRLNPAQVAVQVIGKTATKRVLDSIAPANPVVVSTRGGAVYNSAGIRSVENRFRNPIPDDFWIDEEAGWSGDYTDGPRCIRGDVIIPESGREDEYTQAYFEVLQLNAQTGLTAGESDAEAKRRHLINRLQLDLGFMTLNIGGGLLFDVAEYAQDDASREQFGEVFERLRFAARDAIRTYRSDTELRWLVGTGVASSVGQLLYGVLDAAVDSFFPELDRLFGVPVTTRRRARC